VKVIIGHRAVVQLISCRLDGGYQPDLPVVGLSGWAELEPIPRLDDLRCRMQRDPRDCRGIARLGLGIGHVRGGHVRNGRHRVIQGFDQETVSSRAPIIAASEQGAEQDAPEANRKGDNGCREARARAV
jgi:hypothetical protein